MNWSRAGLLWRIVFRYCIERRAAIGHRLEYDVDCVKRAADGCGRRWTALIRWRRRDEERIGGIDVGIGSSAISCPLGAASKEAASAASCGRHSVSEMRFDGAMGLEAATDGCRVPFRGIPIFIAAWYRIVWLLCCLSLC